MKYFTTDRIKYFKKAYQEIRRYKWLAFLILTFSLLASVFEGFSLGAIIPFLQSLLNQGDKIYLFPLFRSAQEYLMSGPQEDTILKLLVFALGMVILKSIFNYLRVITITKIRTLIRRDLQDRVFYSACEANLSFYYKLKTGNLVSSVSMYTNSIVGFYLILLDMISHASRIIIYGVLLFFISWKFTVVLIALEIIIFPVIKGLFSRIKKVNEETTRKWAELNSRMIEKLGNITTIKIFNMGKYEKIKFHQTATKIAKLEYKNNRYLNVVTPISEVSTMFAIIALFIVAIKVIRVDIIFYMPLILTYLYIFMKAFAEINIFLRSLSKIFESIGPYKAYDKLLESIQGEIRYDGKLKIKNLKDKIVFENVSFEYSKELPILNNLNFRISKGEFISIIGSTGSGKSTIANLITALLLPTSGKILIDGINIEEINTHSWREIIGYISQDITIFNDTIRNNITYGMPKAGHRETEKAAKMAGIHKFIQDLPEKYETILGEKGSNLSGGQKQRIAIARALIRQPEILILDEATSSLDTETEKFIQGAINKYFHGKTIIVIAHRLSTIKKSDRILVIEDGKLVEQGNHNELMKKSGFYKKYYEMQK